MENVSIIYTLSKTNPFLAYDYSCNGILLCTKEANGNMKFIGGKQGEVRDVWVRALLQPGEYYIFVRILPRIKSNPNFRSKLTGDTQA